MGKAFHIDDPLFLWAAKQIQREPLDPYGFDVNWYGTPMRMADVTKNPPLAAYYIAAVAPLLGWSEPALHLAFLVPALTVVLLTYRLAQRMSARPLLAALVVLASPVFLISSSTVMCDVWMVALWLVAVWLWTTGIDRGSRSRLLLAGLATGLCALTKYFGLALVPLLLLYALWKRARLGWGWASFLLSIGIPAAYHVATRALYGRGLLLDAASYATEARPDKWSLASPLVGLAFTGGCVGAIGLLAVGALSRRVLLAGATIAGLVALLVGTAGRVGTHEIGVGTQGWVLAIQFGVLAGGGIGVVALAVADLVKRRDADALLLGLWVLGTLVFAAVINWSTNGRSILPLVPAVGILIARLLGPRRDPKAGSPYRYFALGAGILAWWIAWADLQHANSAKLAAASLQQRYGNRDQPLLFEGHWGFQYYMAALGVRALDVKVPLQPGSIVVLPGNNTNVYTPPAEWMNHLETMQVPSSTGIAVMRTDRRAGFYADLFGPLPYVFGKVPPEQYHVVEISAPGSP